MSSYRDWHVGMKVVCVNSSGRMPSGHQLEERRVYTVTAIDAGLFFEQQTERVLITVGVRLQGLGDNWFQARRFRPVQPRKTDIGIFTAMLNSAKRQVSA